MENLNILNESIRQQLLNLEFLRSELKEFKTKSKAEGLFVERIDEMLSTAIADLLIISDFLYDAENCFDDSDIELLLEITRDETVN